MFDPGVNTYDKRYHAGMRNTSVWRRLPLTSVMNHAHMEQHSRISTTELTVMTRLPPKEDKVHFLDAVNIVFEADKGSGHARHLKTRGKDDNGALGLRLKKIMA